MQMTPERICTTEPRLGIYRVDFHQKDATWMLRENFPLFATGAYAIWISQFITANSGRHNIKIISFHMEKRGNEADSRAKSYFEIFAVINCW